MNEERLWKEQAAREALYRTLTELYASEINCGIASLWDSGWAVWMGDTINGFENRESGLKLEELPEWLHRNALEFYPESAYAKAHR